MLMPNKVINNSTADETLTKEIQRINGYNLEQENRVENALGHKLSIKEQVVSYTTETDLNSFVFLLEGETTSSYVQKRLKKALAIFGSLFAVIILINVINLIFSLNLEINYALFLGLAVIISYIIYKLDYMVLKSVFKQQQKIPKRLFPIMDVYT